MYEAVKTTASAGEIWTIVIVAVGCLAFWLGAVAWADMHPFVRSRQAPDMQGPVLGGMHLGSGGRSVSPNREAPSVLTNVDEMPYDQRDYQPEHDEAAQWEGGARGTGEPWVPVQRGAEPRPAPAEPEPARPASERAGAVPQMPAQRTGEPEPTAGQQGAIPEMPAQRTGESDQAERTSAGTSPAGHATARRSLWPRRTRHGNEP